MSQGSAGTHELRWVVRTATETDVSEIVKLLNHVYGGWGDHNTWLWKYKRNSKLNTITSAVAEHQGKIIGHYGIIPTRVIYQGEILQCVQAVDAAVSPEFRRQGIFVSLGSFILENAIGEGAHFAYAFPGLNSLNVNHELGFHPIQYKPEMVRILQPKKFIIDLLTTFPSNLHAVWQWRYRKDRSPKIIKRLARYRLSMLWVLSWLSAPVWNRGVSIDGIDVKSVETFDSSFDRFSQVCQSNITFGLVKDYSYLTWRYLERPDRDYHILVALEGGDMIGYMIMYYAQDKNSICECEILPGKEHAVFALLEYAGDVALIAGSRVIDIWIADQNPIYTALQKSGFISQHHIRQWAAKWESLSSMLYQIILYSKHLPAQTQKELDIDSSYWSLSMGDSDLV